MKHVHMLYNYIKTFDWISLILTLVVTVIVIMIGIVTNSYVG